MGRNGARWLILPLVWQRQIKRVLLAIAQSWSRNIVHEASFCGICYQYKLVVKQPRCQSVLTGRTRRPRWGITSFLKGATPAPNYVVHIICTIICTLMMATCKGVSPLWLTLWRGEFTVPTTPVLLPPEMYKLPAKLAEIFSLETDTKLYY